MKLIKVGECWLDKNEDGNNIVSLLESNGYILIFDEDLGTENKYIISKEQKKKEKLLRDWDDNRYQ